MRTKTLLLAAALSAAGIATSMAQSNVYSLNVVGYINVPLKSGATAGTTFNLIANPLDLDGTGVNNTMNSVLGTNGWTSGATAFGYDSSVGNPTSGSYVAANWNNLGKFWPTNPIPLLGVQPGNGIFLKNGEPGSAGPTNITLVGNVLQGNLVNPIPSGYSIASSMVPQAGLISDVLLFNPAVLVNASGKAFLYDSSIQDYVAYSVSVLPPPLHWQTQPNLKIAEAVFLFNPGAAGSWDRNFTVQ
jgi:hypothetical protein